MLVDHHLHLENGPYTPHDYPLSWLDQYVETMHQRHVGRMGIVEHGYRFVQSKGILDLPWADRQCLYDLPRYLDFIFDAKARGYPIAVGLEMDYFPGKEAEIARVLESAPFDFVVGSVHFLGDWGIDLIEEVGRWADHDPQEVWERYYETSAMAVQSGLFDILSHPDLPKIFGHRAPRPLTGHYTMLCEALKTSGMALETNTAGRRKQVGEIYPVPELLKVARSMDVPASLASDAHVPGDVGKDFDLAVELLKSCGFDGIVSFMGRERSFHPFDAE